MEAWTIWQTIVPNFDNHCVPTEKLFLLLQSMRSCNGCHLIIWYIDQCSLWLHTCRRQYVIYLQIHIFSRKQSLWYLNYLCMARLTLIVIASRIFWHMPVNSSPPSAAYMRSELGSIGSANGLSPDRRQAITWTNAGLLSIIPPGQKTSVKFESKY